LQLAGYEVLHASAIQSSVGVTAFCGASGVGKSTFAYYLARNGATFWADDAVVLDAEAPSDVVCFQLPFVAHLREPTRTFLKAEGDLPRLPDDAALATAPLHAIVILRRLAEGSSGLRQVPPTEALPLLLPHGVRFSVTDPVRGRSMAAHYLELIARVPILELRFFPSLGDLPRLAMDIEDCLSGIE
jgi:hypothetical protein